MVHVKETRLSINYDNTHMVFIVMKKESRHLVIMNPTILKEINVGICTRRLTNDRSINNVDILGDYPSMGN